MARKKAPPKVEDGDDLVPESFIKIRDITQVSPEDVAKLLAENERLKAELAEEQAARGDAEQRALQQAAATLGQRSEQEVPTGNKVEISMCDGYKTVGYKEDGRPVLKPIWKRVEVPTYFYLIDLPPAGGEGVCINGTWYYHGTVVELDQYQLRSMKEIVYRGWDHERNISGFNENAYRTERRQTVSMKGMRG
jgi:hypothetical protein